jgi:glycosyltransferase involved in cell wall biosynthesis
MSNNQIRTKVLEIFTHNNGYKGGVATMVNTYIESVEQFAHNNCKLTHLNIKPSFVTKNSKINNLIYIFTQRKETKSYFKKNKFDVVHIHTSREFLFLKDVFLAKLIKKRFNIPIILTIHVGDWKTVFHRINWFNRYAIHLLNKYIDETIFLSKTMRKEFISNGMDASKSIVLYNFHNIPYPTKKKVCNEKLQLLFVGAIHREKGIIELLTALKQIKDINFHLSICGEVTDNLNEEIKSFTDELSYKVDFLGYISGEQKTSVFNNSDVLILPSYHEGLPLVILEALGAGCAIISTKVGAIPEILCEENVFWINKKSSIDIVDAIRFITNHPETLRKMQICNKELSKQYTLDNHINQLSLIYNKYGKLKS